MTSLLVLSLSFSIFSMSNQLFLLPGSLLSLLILSLTVSDAFTTRSLRAHFSFPTRSSVTTRMVWRYRILPLAALAHRVRTLVVADLLNGGMTSQNATEEDLVEDRDLDLVLRPGILAPMAWGREPGTLRPGSATMRSA